MKILPIYLSIFTFFILWVPATSQVGINTDDPQATLDVNGDILIQNKLYLENPGDYGIIRGSKLLIKKNKNVISQYDTDISKYGPINYAQFIFQDVGDPGVVSYDTKISTTDYLVTVQGYYFLENGTNDTNIVSYSDNGDDYVEGFKIHAYKNYATNTWFIEAVINNGGLRKSDANIDVDIYLNLIIFRNKFIAKEITSRVVDMSGENEATATLPPGF